MTIQELHDKIVEHEAALREASVEKANLPEDLGYEKTISLNNRVDHHYQMALSYSREYGVMATERSHAAYVEQCEKSQLATLAAGLLAKCRLLRYAADRARATMEELR